MSIEDKARWLLQAIWGFFWDSPGDLYEAFPELWDDGEFDAVWEKAEAMLKGEA